MAFTTWAALKSSMLDDLASGMWSEKSYSLSDGTEVVHRSFSDFKDALDYVTQQAFAEAATSSTPIGRSYGRPVGRFNIDR